MSAPLDNEIAIQTTALWETVSGLPKQVFANSRASLNAIEKAGRDAAAILKLTEALWVLKDQRNEKELKDHNEHQTIEKGSG